jgi:DNA-binding CsgD family transcriptional regulator
MAASGDFPSWLAHPRLVDRESERMALDDLLSALRGGESRALVLHGDPGIGKTALMEYVRSKADGLQVVRTSGVQSEMELAFAGLHQLCATMLDRLDAVPAPQREALESAFGLQEGGAPDVFLIGLAVLSLLSVVAETQPLLCIIDDFQWMDYASTVILAFVARRLGSESLGMVFATRVTGDQLEGLPMLLVEGLRPMDSRALLDLVLPGSFDKRIRDQIVAETRGNPLALLELPRGLAPAEMSVGLQLPGAISLTGSIEESFLRRIEALPTDSRQLLLIAASDPTGNTVNLWRAAEKLEIGPPAAAPIVEAELATFESRVRFRHPLVRSAVYDSAPVEDRRRVHAALAEVVDPTEERWIWHKAQATDGPDEEVAKELERSASQAIARGCIATGGAYLKRAVSLSIDPIERANRAVAAAEGSIRAGALDDAIELLAVAETGRLSEAQQAHVDLARAQLSYVMNRGNEAPGLMVKAAKELEASDPVLARATYLDALAAAIFAGRLASPGANVLDVAGAAASAPKPKGKATPPDLLLKGLAASYNDGYQAGVDEMREALDAFKVDPAVPDEMHWMWLASITAMRVWDDELWDLFSARHVELARETGSFSELPLALTSRTFALLSAGRFAEADSLIEETQAVIEATGSRLAPYGAFSLAAFRGDAETATTLIQTSLKEVSQRGEGSGIAIAEWANAVLHNGLGQYDKALEAAKRGTAYDTDVGTLIWPLVEQIEAASRVGEIGLARDSYVRLAGMTSASGTHWALGLEKRSGALVADASEAEQLYRESIDYLGRTRQRLDLARAHLLYGEWLRRERRRLDAREQLRTAFRMLEAIGALAFADRATRELRATGDVARSKPPATKTGQLTLQEAQIARMASEGLSNPDIGVRLFISPHTVQYHLRKVFAKLGISSRSQLKYALKGQEGLPEAPSPLNG